MSGGLDVEGVLAGHQLIGKSVPAESEHECRYITKPHDGCGCKRLVIGCSGCEWQIEVSDDRIDQHRAHVAAVLREQIAAWLVAEADWRWEPDSEIPAVLAELAALVACVDPSRSDGGSTDPEVRQSADRTSSPSRVPGEET
jgi:hypothetical protein